jgi:hypothetical protein
VEDSQGHVGIPLASADFIESIPMMSRLLKELGVPLDWIEQSDTEIVAKTIGRISGLFYVPEARSTVDNKGRNIIAAQDFVSEYGVRTVFGFGGGYTLSQTFLAIIVFSREPVAKETAQRFMALVNSIKIATYDRVRNNRIFG